MDKKASVDLLLRAGVCALGWSWPLYAAGISVLPVPFFPPGVLLAALIMAGLSQVSAGLRELGSRMVRWRVHWRGYAAALLIPLTVAVMAAALDVAFGAPAQPLTSLAPLAIFPVLLVLRLIDPTNGPSAEEPGWRGFALPRLQADHSPLAATTILALMVALWHLPCRPHAQFLVVPLVPGYTST